MAQGFFITGTDTEIGKTTATVALLKILRHRGLRVAGMKPVSAGCVKTDDGLRNEDALALMAQASIELPYELVNPFAYEPPIAPHIAAEQAGKAIEINTIEQSYHKIRQQADMVLVEGVGGWLVPINQKLTMADVASALNLPVIMVVGIRLGCLNHALLTYDSIVNHDCRCVGWVANCVAKLTTAQNENIEYLRRNLPVPLIGTIPFRSDLPQLDMNDFLDPVATLLQNSDNR